MFWRRKKGAQPAAPPQIGCFGKLQATGDFVRLNAGGEEVGSFDRWLGSGLDMAKRAMGEEFDKSYPASVGLFVYRGEPAGTEPPARGIVGAWAASGDNAGRKYPMIVFGSYDYAQMAAVGPALPIALWPLLAASYELATTGRQLAVDAFVDRVSRIQLPSLEDPDAASAGYRAWLGQQSMQALWDTGFGSDASRFWVLSNLVESVMPFRGQELPNTGLALRLPLGAGDAYAAAVWMDVTQRLAGWERTLVSAFWTPRQTALIHLGAPHFGSFRELLSPTGAAEHVAELCGVPPVDEATAKGRLGPAHANLVDNTDQSIAAFLDALT